MAILPSNYQQVVHKLCIKGDKGASGEKVDKGGVSEK